MAPEVIREEYYDEKIDLWSLGITIIEMMDRVPPHYMIKDEEELFDIIATEPSPTFTYSYPSMYMRGLVAWLLDEDAQSRPSAKDVLLVCIHIGCFIIDTYSCIIRKLMLMSRATCCNVHHQLNLFVSSTMFCLHTKSPLFSLVFPIDSLCKLSYVSTSQLLSPFPSSFAL